MPKNKEVNIEIIDWWIKWWDDNVKHTVCMIVKINGELRLIEKELEND